MSAFVAIDWGTTNRRVFLVEAGEAVRVERDALGIRAVPPGGFPAEMATLRERFAGLPMLLAGMVGSNRGWIDVGYVPCPATPSMLAAALHRMAPDVAIVPGVRTAAGARADVMRGEEVQLLGAVATGAAPPDALLCQPGTHCKWAWMRGGAIGNFTTAMTGELFALLRDHALIGAAMTDPVADGAAFREGVDRSADGDLLSALFGVRPASLLRVRPDEEAASFVSGLLIGADVRAQIRTGQTVHLLADAALRALYAAAIAAVGGRTHAIDSEASFVAGIARIRELSS